MSALKKPSSNYFKTPNDFFMIDDLSAHERIVLLYLIRHTWGFSEYGKPKRMTIDEFEKGRKRADGTRIDKGCQIGRGTIHRALENLETAGYINIETDDSDKARIKKSYQLVIDDVEEDEISVPEKNVSVPERNAEFHNGTLESHSGTRSEKDTLKDTKEKETKKKKTLASSNPDDAKIKEMIAVWNDIAKPLDTSKAYANRTQRKGAELLIGAGYTADTVREYLVTVSTADYCPTLDKVTDRIQRWHERHKPVAPASIPDDEWYIDRMPEVEIVNPEVRAALDAKMLLAMRNK